MENPTTIAVLPPVSSVESQTTDTIGLEATTMTEIEIKEDTTSVRTGGTDAPATSEHGPIEPIPMSFPAVLRNQGINHRFAHLRSGSLGSVSVPVVPKKSRRDDKDGKRWVRRKENARFIGNPHIVLATQSDYSILPPTTKKTFPQPLPSYLSRNNPIPHANPAIREPNSANAGRFSMSLKGMRKELRKAGPNTEQLVRDVEEEMVGWLRNGGVLVNPDELCDVGGLLPGKPVGTQEGVREVLRTPVQLVWAISDNAFTRYVVHCCARYHNVVSYSKDTSGQRLTYLLRPNVTRPDFTAPSSLETPPATESELSTFEFASESDFASDAHSDAGGAAGIDSEVEASQGTTGAAAAAALSDIEESTPGSPASLAGAPPPHDLILDDSWSIIGESDHDGDGGDEGDLDLTSSIDSLSIHENQQDRTRGNRYRDNDHAGIRVQTRIRQTPLRSSNVWERHRRSASSPSRSPARRVPPRGVGYLTRFDPPKLKPSATRSFYDYLFT